MASIPKIIFSGATVPFFGQPLDALDENRLGWRNAGNFLSGQTRACARGNSGK
jgi:hypothetical protein